MEQRFAQVPSPTGTRPHCSLLLPSCNALRKCLSHWDSATLQLAPPMEQSFVQVPLPQGFGHIAACSFHGAMLRVSASSAGTRPHCSLLLSWSNASCKCLSHWDWTTLQLAPPIEQCFTQVPLPLDSVTLQLTLSMEQRFAQVPFPLGLDHLAACSSNGATLRASASRTGTRPHCSLLLPWSNTLRKCLSHWDSATLQLALPMEQRFAQVPLPLGLDYIAACSSYGAKLHASASPTGTRPPCSLLLPWSKASCKCLSHWDSTTLQLALLVEQRFVQVPLPLRLGHLAACFSHEATLRTRASPTGTWAPCSLLPPHRTQLRSSTYHTGTWHTMENKVRRSHKCLPRTLLDLICLPEFKNQFKIF
ncbi:hypothetical protein Adt_41947 [Abeliophyllum distichum]|uniref:Uncharacterized protein n=1 Tax=Abeliophyllum distichum TaxID=126358 RepID=A0ABD1PQA4_9LAMI